MKDAPGSPHTQATQTTFHEPVPSPPKMEFTEVEASTAALTRAGFWRRFVAVTIDQFILSIFLLPLSIALPLLPLAGGTQVHPKVMFFLNLSQYLIGMVLNLVYTGLMLSKKGATLGKMAMKLQVLDIKTGGYPPFGQAALREFCKLLSALILMLGFLMAAIGNKRALHDYIFDTVVIKKRG